MNNIVIIGAIVVVVVLLIFIRLDRKRKRAMREWAETEKEESKEDRRGKGIERTG